MKTFSPQPRHIERRWYVVDADGAVLGRLASEVAKVLRGKHKPIFAPHIDTGDNVIVINARRVRLTGGKETKKHYHRHSGYPGGLRSLEYTRLMSERPAVAVEKAVKGMLPKNRLGRQMLSKLAVYEGADHPHQAQKPVRLGLGEIPPWEGLPVPKERPRPSAAKPKPETTGPKGRTRARASGGTRARGEAKPAGSTRGGSRAQSKQRTSVTDADAPPKAKSSSRRRTSASGEAAKSTEAKAGRSSRPTRRSRAKKES